MSSVKRLGLAGTVALCATALAAAEGTTIPKGTSVELTLQDSLSTRTAKVGDTFRATVVPAIDIDDQPVLPEGTVVVGKVELVKRLVELAPLVSTGRKIDTVFIGRSSAGRASTLVGDDLAEGYSNSGLGAAEATVTAGTQITMEFAEPLTGLPAAKRTAANPGVRHIRVAPASVAAAQQALTKKGYYHGEADGHLGSVFGATRQAIICFQLDHEQVLTGDLTRRRCDCSA
jgi:hypothetical protein